MQIQLGDGTATLRVAGEMTIYNAAESKPHIEALLGHGPRLEIDLEQLGEIDTAGIQLLMLAKREAEAQGKSLSLINHSSAALDAIDLFNLGGFFGDPMLLSASRNT